MDDKLTMMINRLKQEHSTGAKNETEQKYECELCKDSGFVTKIDENGIRYSCRCKCQDVKRAKEMMRRSGISESFLQKTFENFQTSDIPQLSNAKEKAVNYARNFEQMEHNRQNSILFCGQVGSGKTHLGTAICGELMRRGIAVVYMAYRSVVTQLKQNILDEQNYSQELSRYISARVLYIDDFLKGKLTDADVNIVYEIANQRYMNNMPMIISTEKTLSEVLEFDEAIGSRILEMSRGNIAQLKGRELNYRMKRHDKKEGEKH